MSKIKIEDGGLYFPGERHERLVQTAEEAARVAPTWADVKYPGITRRDECADRIAASMASVQWERYAHGGPVPDEGLIARLAYVQADSVIAEGRKGGEGWTDFGQ